MSYSLVGIIAIAVHLIINLDIFFDPNKKMRFRGEKYYVFFLLSVIAYHITDGFWGFLYDAHLTLAVYIDTTVYFVAMAASILFWGIFVYHYLDLENKGKAVGKSILIAGFVIFVFQIVAIIINFFQPILFSVSEDCVYKAEIFRYVMLSAQILIYSLVSIFTFVMAVKAKGSTRRKYFAIGFFGIVMIAAITLQVFFPLLPMYSFGFLFGVCALHTFVIRDEIASREMELDETKQRISIDPLTGMLSKHAYVDAQDDIKEKIINKNLHEFAVVMFDLNHLKEINDTYGHGEGDIYLKESAKLIEKYYEGVPIYRYGGDEFVAFLLGEHYEKRDAYLSSFNKRIDENLEKGNRDVIAAGMAIFVEGSDTNVLQVFSRADREMYERKLELKKRQG